MTSKLENYDRSPSNKSDKIAPDGGFGWIILIAYGAANVSFVAKRLERFNIGRL